MPARIDRELREHGHMQAFAIIRRRRGSRWAAPVQGALAAPVAAFRHYRLPSKPYFAQALAREAFPAFRQRSSGRQLQCQAGSLACSKTGWSRAPLRFQGCDTAFQLHGLNCLALGLQDGRYRLAFVRRDVAGSDGIGHRANRSDHVGG